MALRSPSSTPRWDLGHRDSPPAESSSPTSQGGSSNGAGADVARKTKEVDHLLAKLEKEGVEVDGKIASMIDDEIARIIAEVTSDKIKDPYNNGAGADVARKTKEVDHLLAKLEKEGVEIDDKMTSMIDDVIARIKAEVASDKIEDPKTKVMVILLAMASFAFCFVKGVEWKKDEFRKKLGK